MAASASSGETWLTRARREMAWTEEEEEWNRGIEEGEARAAARQGRWRKRRLELNFNCVLQRLAMPEDDAVMSKRVYESSELKRMKDGLPPEDPSRDLQKWIREEMVKRADPGTVRL